MGREGDEGMNQRTCSRVLMLLAVALLIPACGGGGGGGGGAGGVRVQGNAQKGPLITGSSVTVFPLDSTLVATGLSYASQISSDLGSFSLTSPINDPFAEVVASGFYFDELTAALSAAPLTIRALTPVSSTTTVRVNLITTMMKDRVRFLVQSGATFAAASDQAKNEVLAIFGIDGTLLGDPTTMDVSGSSASDAALIAVSAILLQHATTFSGSEAEKVAKLSLTISNIASDLGPDGTLNPASTLPDELVTSTHALDIPTVTANLTTIYANQGISITVPDITAYVDPLMSQYPWQPLASLPAPRFLHASSAVNGKIYVIGGVAASLDGAVLEYDPIADSWTPRASMPTPRASLSCETVAGKIYAIGGHDGVDFSDKVEEYDPVLNTWSTKTALPGGRAHAASAVVGGKIYIISGVLSGYVYTPVVSEYDPVGNSWSTKTPIPTARDFPVGAALNGKIYVAGGEDGMGNRLTTLDEFDPVGNSWASRAPMQYGRDRAAAAVVAGRLYVLGGHNGNATLPMNEEYDPIGNSWVDKKSMNYQRSLFSASVDTGLIYVFGGDDQGTVREFAESYDPTKDN
jgi:N-acetylneuraminic acid mutarotase